MLENIITFLQNVPEMYVLLIVLALCYIENVFPPAPSDAVLLFAGTMIPLGNVHFLWLLLLSTLGSTLGFVTMFLIGLKFDKKIIETGKIKFIKIDTIMKVEHWFQKWGYWIILINRFLSGTRAVISFFAGMSLLDLKKTTILSIAGAFIWNFVLIYVGMVFSENWQEIYSKIDIFGYIIFGVLVIISLIILIKHKYFNK